MEKGAVLDVPILSASPVAFELEVSQTVELDGGEVLLCKIRNVLVNEELTDKQKTPQQHLESIHACAHHLPYLFHLGRSGDGRMGRGDAGGSKTKLIDTTIQATKQGLFSKQSLSFLSRIYCPWMNACRLAAIASMSYVSIFASYPRIPVRRARVEIGNAHVLEAGYRKVRRFLGKIDCDPDDCSDLFPCDVGLLLIDYLLHKGKGPSSGSSRDITGLNASIIACIFQT